MGNVLEYYLTCMTVSDIELYTMAVNQNIFNVILVYDKEKICHLFIFIIYKRFTKLLATENIKGIESVTKALEKDINVYLKLFVLLYADDTVLLAETADDLHQLYCFELYCETWKLKVNAAKTKF